MASLNLRNPNGYDGQPGTQHKQGIVRLATDEEVLAGTATNVVVTPAQLATISTGANFASPPALGFGSTTPRPVHATTLSATGNSTIGTTGATVNTIGSNNASSTTTITAGAAVLSMTNAGSAFTGSVTSSTTLTATLGAITATNGNLVLAAAGNKLVIHATTAASDSVGTTAAMITGAVTITSSAITASSKIIYSRRTLGTAMGNVSITAQAGGSAVLTSDEGTETSSFDYLIIN